MEMEMSCENLPSLVSSFVDTFVDFCVTDGMFMPPAPPPPSPPPPTFISLQSSSSENQRRRLIAIGDLHGDLMKSKEALRLAGLIDSKDNWCGGGSTLVQVGDVLDRGHNELKILYYFERLKRQAVKTGGNVITMNGNHEILNLDGDFRYVTPSGLDEFNRWAFWYSIGSNVKRKLGGGYKESNDLYDGIPSTFPFIKRRYVQGFRSRIAALRPNGPISTRFLSNNSTVLVVDDSVFVHGGLLASHVDYGLERINQEVSDWISGTKRKVTSSLVRGRNSVVWLRIFSNEQSKDCDCRTLEHVLSTIPGARRMIMGHTIQESGINGVCNNMAIRIDVGMSRGCINGLPEVLEITNTHGVRILTSNPNPNPPPQQPVFIPQEVGPKQVPVKA
uniref:shewanella-like protein phosphatase 2 n=1 Tax=Erigeron canadensis TaxID=72917 RepID=UPI001CB89746|nr:shewanella-like protein phosphatase 2 [Erigeron canadensis]